MYTENYEHEIDLKDLLFAVFYRWRLLLLAALAGALLAGGINLLKNSAPAVETDALQAYEEELAWYEDTSEALKSSIENIKQRINAQYHYMAEAPIILINPYEELSVTADLMLEMTGADKTGALSGLLQAYRNALLDGDYLAELAQKQGTKTAWLREQIRAEYVNIPEKSIRDTSIAEILVMEPGYGNVKATLHLTAIGLTKSDAEELMEVLLKETERLHSVLGKEYGEHKLQVVRQSVSECVDEGLMASQERKYNYVSSLNRNLTELEDRLKKLEQPVYEELTGSVSAESLLKYIIIGFVMGGFAASFAVCVLFVMNDKVASDKEIKNRFNIKSLGSFSRSLKRKPFDFVDQWLRRMEGTDMVYTDDSVYEMIETNVRNYAGGSQVLFLTGFASEEKFDQIAKRLALDLPEYTFKTERDVVMNASARRLMAECESVVLIEETEVSRYSAMQKELEIIQNLKLNVAGVILA